MSRLTGRFDGRAVVLDHPQSVCLPPETQVALVVVALPFEPDIRVPDEHERRAALAGFREASREFLVAQAPDDESLGRGWTRNDIYDENL